MKKCIVKISPYLAEIFEPTKDELKLVQHFKLQYVFSIMKNEISFEIEDVRIEPKKFYLFQEKLENKSFHGRKVTYDHIVSCFIKYVCSFLPAKSYVIFLNGNDSDNKIQHFLEKSIRSIRLVTGLYLYPKVLPFSLFLYHFNELFYQGKVKDMLYIDDTGIMLNGSNRFNSIIDEFIDPEFIEQIKKKNHDSFPMHVLQEGEDYASFMEGNIKNLMLDYAILNQQNIHLYCQDYRISILELQGMDDDHHINQHSIANLIGYCSDNGSFYVIDASNHSNLVEPILQTIKDRGLTLHMLSSNYLLAFYQYVYNVIYLNAQPKVLMEIGVLRKKKSKELREYYYLPEPFNFCFHMNKLLSKVGQKGPLFDIKEESIPV